MYKSYSMELAGRTLTVDVGRVAKQANGAALMHYGDTTVLSTATASKEPREGIDFFPLSVEYEEKMYAVGKIPGGFNKREGKASEHAILTSRVIDRPMRPLFPKDYRNDAEVCSSQQIFRFKALYDYPNKKLHQRDEKHQINQFLADWLRYCLAHGAMAIPVY